MKGLSILLLLAGALFIAGERSRAAEPAQEPESEPAQHSVVGVELHGDTMVYRTVGHTRLLEDNLGRRYRLHPLPEYPKLRHTVSIEIGIAPTTRLSSADDAHDAWQYRPPEAFYNERYYYNGPLMTSGVYGLAYGYRANRWLEVGASLSYSAYWGDLRRASDGSIASQQKEHYLSVMPYVRAFWLNRNSIRLYSALHAGYQWAHTKYYLSEYGNHNKFAGQVTLVGLRVGRRLFGFAEWGVGTRGVFVCGVGYCFGNNQ